MLEIKTIVRPLNESNLFDEEVNSLINNGYILTLRQMVPIMDGAVLYAELERVEEDEEDDDNPDDVSIWSMSRNPSSPYYCEECGYTPDMTKSGGKLPNICPGCHRQMVPPVA